MSRKASVSNNSHHRPRWAPKVAATALPIVVLALACPLAAAQSSNGGVPSPDPSTQFSPDPAPSGGQFASNGGGHAPPRSAPSPQHVSTAPTGNSGPSSAAPTTVAHTTGTAAHHRPRHRTAPAHRSRHHSRSAPDTSPSPVHKLTALFATSPLPALQLPGPAATAADSGSGDALVLASVALLLLVMTGFLVVRASARVLQGERPA
jgi:hypothetical protein